MTGVRARLLVWFGLVLPQTVAAATAALIIDDVGYSRERARRALALPPPVAIAVLPYAPYSRSIARAAGRFGTEVLVHMPMEADHGPIPPHALRADMDAPALREGVRQALAAVPGAIGINNHEGSRLTGLERPMRIVMRQLRRQTRPLLFIDSRTTAATRAEAAARQAGVPVARRDVFLDDDRDPVAVMAATRRWLQQARRTGCALAIGHPHRATLRVLERVLPRADDVDRVDLETYIERCGTPAAATSTDNSTSLRPPTDGADVIP